jgi:hypothetical protein
MGQEASLIDDEAMQMGVRTSKRCHGVL